MQAICCRLHIACIVYMRIFFRITLLKFEHITDKTIVIIIEIQINTPDDKWKFVCSKAQKIIPCSK